MPTSAFEFFTYFQDDEKHSVPRDDPKLALYPQNESQADKVTSFSSGESISKNTVASAVTNHSGDPATDSASISTDPLLDPHNIPWKIDEEELATQRTYKLTEKIRK